MANGIPKMGKQQMQIMECLWRKKQATAREITDELAQDQPIAHSTVQTLLRQLEGKRAVGHDIEDRTFVFYPLSKRTEVVDSATDDFVWRVFHGSAYRLVCHLLQQERIPAEELAQLKEMLAASEEKKS